MSRIITITDEEIREVKKLSEKIDNNEAIVEEYYRHEELLLNSTRKSKLEKE